MTRTLRFPMTRPAVMLVATAIVVALTGRPHALGRRELPPQSLWHLVQVCAGNWRLTSLTFPCRAYTPPNGADFGSAVVPVPGEKDILVVPAEPISGIESPAILAPGAPNLWARAWALRGELGFGPAPDRLALGMAVNSVLSRSQEQLHLHLSCVSPSVRRAIDANIDAIGADWTPFPGRLKGHLFLARRLVSDTPEPDPFGLLAAYAEPLDIPMGGQVLAAIPARFGADDGFVLLTTAPDEPARGEVAGEDLLDVRCRALS